MNFGREGPRRTPTASRAVAAGDGCRGGPGELVYSLLSRRISAASAGATSNTSPTIP